MIPRAKRVRVNRRTETYADWETLVALSADMHPGRRLVLLGTLSNRVPVPMYQYRATRAEIEDFDYPVPMRERNKVPVVKGEVPKPPGDWTTDAACKGMSMQYRTFQAHIATISRAEMQWESDMKEVCKRCLVLDECAAWALTTPDPAFDMLAGGMSPKERRQRRNASAVM
jgi:hypothetical protein